jgi:hypothetical protein
VLGSFALKKEIIGLEPVSLSEMQAIDGGNPRGSGASIG